MDKISVEIGRAFDFFINHEKEINNINDYIDIKKMLNDNLILGEPDLDRSNRKQEKTKKREQTKKFGRNDRILCCVFVCRKQRR